MLHYAVHEHTASELIYDRVDNEKPYVGMKNFKGDYITIDDVKIAKNYLSEIELQRLNLFFRLCRIASIRAKKYENVRLDRRTR